MKCLLLVGLLSFALFSSAQNNFFDAQYLASVTQDQLTLMKLYTSDTTQMSVQDKTNYYSNLPITISSFSSEEIATIKECYTFLTTKQANLFTVKLERDLINTALLKQILMKFAAAKPKNVASAGGAGFADQMVTLAKTASPGLTNTISRLSSTDFQNMLIDATATYIAESFKQDVVYTFFSQVQDKLKDMPEFTTLFPKTTDKIIKLDPFNFNDLGNSWKQAFEGDIQVLPVSFRDLIKNGPPNTWYGKLKDDASFKYYSYSVDILQPLIKGYHPVEILEMLDKQYLQAANGAATLDEYQGIIHFLNILQASVQDTTQKSGSQTNTWISFNQLKQLNTANEQLYFFALIYQQDPDFFDNNGQLGHKIKSALLTNNAAVLKKVIAELPDFLILLNQVENSVADISKAKSQKQNTTELIATYMKNVLDILKQTNTLLTNTGVDAALTAKINKYLGYGDIGYSLYTSITSKNYSGLIDNGVQLIDSIAGNNSFATLLTSNLPGLLTSYNAIMTETGKPLLELDKFTELIMANWNGQGILTDNLITSTKTTIGYATLPQVTQNACDEAVKQFQALAVKVNAFMLQGANPLTVVTTVLNNYNAVYTAVHKANINASVLITTIGGFISADGIDENALDKWLKALPEYKALDSAGKVEADRAITALNGLIDQANVSWKANNGTFSRIAKTVAALAKYGKIVAMIANAQSSDDLKNVIKTYVMPSGSFAVQRSSIRTLTISAQVGAIAALESDNNNIWTTIRPNIGLTAPIGLEYSWGKSSDKPTKHQYLYKDGTTKYLTGTSHSLFVQVFDIVAPLNYRLTKDSGSLPSRIQLAQIFSPGLSYNWGLKDLPFDLGLGIQYTPSLRTIGTTPQANSFRLFFRISWVKPLIPIATKNN